MVLCNCSCIELYKVDMLTYLFADILHLNFELCEILQLIAKGLRLDGPHCIFGQLIFGKIITIFLSPEVRF